MVCLDYAYLQGKMREVEVWIFDKKYHSKFGVEIQLKAISKRIINKCFHCQKSKKTIEMS